jgi:hypothetical protein
MIVWGRYRRHAMNFDSFFLGCLLEGLPIKLANIFKSNPDFLQQLSKVNKDLHNCISAYLQDKDLVTLYRRAAKLHYSESAIPIHLRDSSIKKLLNELANRFELVNPPIALHGSPPAFPLICDYLNPLRERETYVLKTRVHHWMYEQILKKHNINSLLEIGVFYGGSTHAWRIRLPQCSMYSLDINYPLQDSRLLERTSSNFRQGSSIDLSALDSLCEDGPFDLIIDDASHIPSHQISTFIYLTNKNMLSKVYVVEDVHDEIQGDKGFSRFVSLISKYQEDASLEVFLGSVRELLCNETAYLLEAVKNYPKYIDKLSRTEISRYGGNYVFAV